MRRAVLAFMAVAIVAVVASAEGPVEFEPKVVAVGGRVTVKIGVPAGAQLLVGGKPVSVVRETAGISSFLMPPGVSNGAFIEIVSGGKTVMKSAVPVIVSGSSLAPPAKLIGLKEAMDVYGYADTRPSGGEKPEVRVRPVLKLDDDEILTLGEPAPFRLGPPVEIYDLASAGHMGMMGTGLIITARPPKKKTPVPLPPPPPED